MIARRVPLLLPAGLSLLLGGWAGLAMMGWLPAPSFGASHGAFMALGFLGTLISLERAVGLRRRAAYAAPALFGLGVIVLTLAPGAAPYPFLAAALVLCALHALMLRMQPQLHAGVMALGALALVAGCLLWIAGASPQEAAAWWSAFLVLTVAGERLELSRVLSPPAAASRAVAALVVVLLAGLVIQGPIALRPFGAALAGLALWLLCFDLARRLLGREGPAGFTGSTLLIGYGWLLLSGLLWIAFAPTVPDGRHDAALHSLLLGFVISMVFGHAPMVARGVLGREVRFSLRFHLHVALLSAGIAERVAGDLLGNASLLASGGLLTGFAIALFMLQTAFALRPGGQRRAQPRPADGGPRQPERERRQA